MRTTILGILLVLMIGSTAFGQNLSCTATSNPDGSISVRIGGSGPPTCAQNLSGDAIIAVKLDQPFYSSGYLAGWGYAPPQANFTGPGAVLYQYVPSSKVFLIDPVAFHFTYNIRNIAANVTDWGHDGGFTLTAYQTDSNWCVKKDLTPSFNCGSNYMSDKACTQAPQAYSAGDKILLYFVSGNPMQLNIAWNVY